MSNTFYFLFFGIALVIKIIAIFYTNFDLFGDEAQYWAWSQNLDFGYYSKPPLLPWVIRIFTILFGDSFEILKIIPIGIYIFTSYIIFLISYELYQNKNLAIISAISFYLIPAVSFSSFLLSTDVLLIFFWSLSLLFLLKIRKKPIIRNFCILGIFLGLSFLAKYAAIYFLLSLIIIIFFDNKLKEVFFKNFLNVIIFLISTFTTLLPNIIWNIKNNWITLSHTSDNAALNRIDINLLQGFEFILSQGLMLGPILFLFFIFSIKKLKINFEEKFLISFSIPIILIVFVESILVRANANWAAVALVPLMLLLFNHAYVYSKKIIIINNFINFIFCLVLFILVSINSSLSIFDRINGISSFAFLLEEKHMEKNKFLVVEDRLLYSNLNYLFRNSNKTLFTPHNPNKKITSHFHLSAPLDSSFNKSFIFLGNPTGLDYLINKNIIKKNGSANVVFRKNPIDIYEVIF